MDIKKLTLALNRVRITLSRYTSFDKVSLKEVLSRECPLSNDWWITALCSVNIVDKISSTEFYLKPYPIYIRKVEIAYEEYVRIRDSYFSTYKSKKNLKKTIEIQKAINLLKRHGYSIKKNCKD